MVNKVVEQIPAYYLAIQKSTETAQRGCTFTTDALDFCQRLLRAEDKVEDMKSRLESIKKVAQVTHAGAKEMNNLFKLVRIELFKVSATPQQDNSLTAYPYDRFQKSSLWTWVVSTYILNTDVSCLMTGSALPQPI